MTDEPELPPVIGVWKMWDDPGPDDPSGERWEDWSQPELPQSGPRGVCYVRGDIANETLDALKVVIGYCIGSDRDRRDDIVRVAQAAIDKAEGTSE